jgi:hypothetical protein
MLKDLEWRPTLEGLLLQAGIPKMSGTESGELVGTFPTDILGLMSEYVRDCALMK